ncbi:MAG: alpha-galactosidase [Bacteroidales bacterium]|nr:alpha-galactosidase [Bacteroidales bacterium]
MKRLSVIAASLLFLAGCAPKPTDSLLCSGRIVTDGVERIVTYLDAEGFDGLTVRSIAFVNTGTKPLKVDAMETSRIHLKGKEIWSFQPSSSGERLDWAMPIGKGFYQRNYLGMNDSDYGGGIPMVSLWTPDANISVGLAEPVLRLVSMPVRRRGNRAEACIRQDFEEPVTLVPGDTLKAYDQFIMLSSGDFFNPLREFTQYMQERFGFEPPVSPAAAFEPVWCAWGYERTFTVDEVIGTLPKVVELGFKWVDVDDGYQICEGDWETNDRIGPDGMRRMTDAIHDAGLMAKLWWAPMCADPGSSLATNHPELLLVQKDGTHEDISWWDAWYLSPIHKGTMDYTLNLVDRFMNDWGFDGFKLDGQYLNLCAPDYNPASDIDYPEQACERYPEFVKGIRDHVASIKSDAVVQLCPCGCAVNFYYLPYINQAVASDPTSSAQIRLKRKTYAAMCPSLAYYADHVELSDGGLDFPSQVGVGGVIGTKFTWPKPNPDATECGGSLLTAEKEALLRKWVPIYSEKMLSRGNYLNLYDFGFDKPEAHVIEKDGAVYYAFYAPQWNGEPIELRGLTGGRRYTVTEYTSDEKRSYTVDGDNPVIFPTFENNYLIEVK